MTNKDQYRRMVGKLIYLSHTEPDIAYAVSVVSRFMLLPQVQHMTIVMRILRYLKGTSSRGIFFKANWHLDLGGNLVTWNSNKQKVVVLSSTEAEFKGIAKGVIEILWVRKLLRELNL